MPYPVELCNSAITSLHSYFFDRQFIFLCLLQCFCSVHRVLSYKCHVGLQLPLISSCSFLSPNTPHILFQFFQPFCTPCVTSVSSSPSSDNVDRRYFNVFTLFTGRAYCLFLLMDMPKKNVAASNRFDIFFWPSSNNLCVRFRIGNFRQNTKSTYGREGFTSHSTRTWLLKTVVCVCIKPCTECLSMARLHVAVLLHNLLIIPIIWYFNCMFIIF